MDAPINFCFIVKGHRHTRVSHRETRAFVDTRSGHLMITS